MNFHDPQLDKIPQFEGLEKFAKDKIRKILAQREEVCEAFVAKYGFGPERFVQANRTTPTCQEWSVRRKTDEEIAKESELQMENARIANLQYLLQQSVKYLKYDAEGIGNSEAIKLLQEIKNATHTA